jgi:hypothetical protein
MTVVDSVWCDLDLEDGTGSEMSPGWMDGSKSASSDMSSSTRFGGDWIVWLPWCEGVPVGKAIGPPPLFWDWCEWVEWYLL